MIKINILGEDYTLERTSPSDDKALETLSGYCDSTVKKIVVNGYPDRKKCIPDGNGGFSIEWAKNTPTDVENIGNVIQKTIRHEIVHAFLAESGLDSECDWAMSEEMVDWIANQGLKIYKAWQDAGAV